MKKINIRKTYYHIRHRYLTMNNVVIGVALIIAASWAWASVGVMERNFNLQKEVDALNREATLIELETESLAYQQNYYKSSEYQELAVRERLGYADPGEKVLILPPNSEAAKQADESLPGGQVIAQVEPTSNFQQWVNFLFGGNKNK